MGVTILTGYPVEMHKVYHAWFVWGFWANIIIFGLFNVFAAIETYYSKKIAFIGHAVSGSIYCVHCVIWFVFGSIWRFSKVGTVAAGDKLERLSGSDINAWRN